jgi:catechol 2,3-dioxygenase-like lactoylglutathione lyase family enzyme
MAMVCVDPGLLRDYYCRWFGFEVLSSASDGTIFLTDGYLNVALIQKGSELAEGAEPGLHHVGFHVESIDEIRRKLQSFDSALELEKRPPSDPYSQYRIKDGGALAIDISEKGYGIDGEKRIPGIRHTATGNKDPEKQLEFYEKVFGMREVEISRGQSEGGPRTRGCVADGFVNICLVKRETDPRSASHFGILMREPGDVVAKIRAAHPDRPELWQPNRPGVEFHILDLERNAVSLSDRKGWEVDVGKWDRIDY